MKLYFSKGACSLTPRILINELQLNCEYEAVDLQTKKTASGDDFLTINPKGEVPTLQLSNGEILTENAVILQYLAKEHHATHLLPPDDDFDYYRVLEWLNFVTTDLHKGIGLLFNPMLPEDFKNNGYLPIVYKRLAFVNARLETNQYLMGNDITLPDFYLFVVLRWAKYFKFDFAKFSALDVFFNNMSKYPAVHLSLQQEHLAPKG